MQKTKARPVLHVTILRHNNTHSSSLNRHLENRQRELAEKLVAAINTLRTGLRDIGRWFES